MLTLSAFLVLAMIALLLLYKLANTALRQRCDVRAGAKLGPGAFFLEVKERAADKKPSEKK